MQDGYKVHIKKEAIKFSAAHMTVFPDGTKEALHGHNYSVGLTLGLRDAGLENMVSFAELKDALIQLCSYLDEKVLIAEECPYLKWIKQTKTELEFTLCKKRYVLPRDEVVLLALENISTELLALEFCSQFVQALDPAMLLAVVTHVTIQIDESNGQGASFTWNNPHLQTEVPAPDKKKASRSTKQRRH